MPIILTEFTYGNINPNERSFIRNLEYGKAVKVVSDIEAVLLKALNENAKPLYDQFAAEFKRTPTKLVNKIVRGKIQYARVNIK